MNRKNKFIIASLTLTSWIYPSQSHNQTLNRYSSLLNIICYTNSKIEGMTGKKRSLISPKVIKAWKTGALQMTYLKSCELALLNPRSYTDEMITEKKELYGHVKKILMAHDSKAESLLADKNSSSMNSLSIPRNQESSFFVLNSEKKAAQKFTQLAERLRYSSRCERHFIGDKRSGFGSLGKVVKTTLSNNSASDLIRHNINFEGACPGYLDMTVEQRRNLWVFVMMSMSHFESSCKESATNLGPYGIAAGLLQLHHNSEDIYSKWDPDLNCERGSSFSAKKSLKCALTMIGNQINKGQPFFNDNSHWQVLRKAQSPGSQAYQIKYAISQIPDCMANPYYFVLDLKWKDENRKEVHNYKSHHPLEVALKSKY